jgi:hypothetical protein
MAGPPFGAAPVRQFSGPYTSFNPTQLADWFGLHFVSFIVALRLITANDFPFMVNLASHWLKG